MTWIWAFLSIFATVLLPLAMLPVRPITFMDKPGCCRRYLLMNRGVDNCSGKAPFVKRLSVGVVLIALSLLCIAFFSPGPIQRASYMGAHYCGSCHSEEYKSWANSPHAKAHASLPQGNKSDPACLSCHATGYMEKNEPILEGVQCERSEE